MINYFIAVYIKHAQGIQSSLANQYGIDWGAGGLFQLDAQKWNKIQKNRIMIFDRTCVEKRL